MKPDAEDDRQDEAARPVWDGSAQLRDESGTGVDVSARVQPLCEEGWFRAGVGASCIRKDPRPSENPRSGAPPISA